MRGIARSLGPAALAGLLALGAVACGGDDDVQQEAREPAPVEAPQDDAAAPEAPQQAAAQDDDADEDFADVLEDQGGYGDGDDGY